jgi:hypothetical protein
LGIHIFERAIKKGIELNPASHFIFWLFQQERTSQRTMMGVLDHSPVAVASHDNNPVVKDAEDPPTTSGTTKMTTPPPSVLEVRLGEAEEASTVSPPSPTSCGTSVQEAAASYKELEAVLSPVSIIPATATAKTHYHPHDHHHHPMTLPPTKRDDRKLFVGGLPPDGTFPQSIAFFGVL